MAFLFNKVLITVSSPALLKQLCYQGCVHVLWHRHTYSSVSFTVLVTGNLCQIAIRALLNYSQNIAGPRTVRDRNQVVLAVLLWSCLPSKRSGLLVLGVHCCGVTVLLFFHSTRLHWHFPCRACHFSFNKNIPCRGIPKLCPLFSCLKMWSSFQMNLSNSFSSWDEGGGEKRTWIWYSQIMLWYFLRH